TARRKTAPRLRPRVLQVAHIERRLAPQLGHVPQRGPHRQLLPRDRFARSLQQQPPPGREEARRHLVAELRLYAAVACEGAEAPSVARSKFALLLPTRRAARRRLLLSRRRCSPPRNTS